MGRPEQNTSGKRTLFHMTAPPMKGRAILKSRWFMPLLQGITLSLLAVGITAGFLGTQTNENSWTRWIFWDLWWS